jgi:hypothetical protein
MKAKPALSVSILGILFLWAASEAYTGVGNTELYLGHCQKRGYEECDDDTEGASTFAPQLLWLDTDLLTRVVDFEQNLQPLTFDFSNNYAFSLGGMGLSDRHGFRFGGGLWFGYKSFDSDEHIRTLTDSTGDTLQQYQAVTTLRVFPVYGGLLTEKSFDISRISLFAGGFLGGGAYFIWEQIRKVDQIFSDSEADSVDWTEQNNAVAIAPMVVMDIHGGISVEITPIFHLGVEAVLLMSYAPEGFVTGSGFGDFFTVSPGIRLRVTTGRAG